MKNLYKIFIIVLVLMLPTIVFGANIKNAKDSVRTTNAGGSMFSMRPKSVYSMLPTVEMPSLNIPGHTARVALKEEFNPSAVKTLLPNDSYAQTNTKSVVNFFKQYTTFSQYEVLEKAVNVLGPKVEQFKIFKRSLTPGDVNEFIYEGLKSSLGDYVVANDMGLSHYEKIPYNVKKHKNLLEFNSIVYSNIDGYDAHIEAKVVINTKTREVISCEYSPKSLRGLIVKFTPYQNNDGYFYPDATSDHFVGYVRGTLEFMIPSGETIRESVTDGWHIPMKKLGFVK